MRIFFIVSIVFLLSMDANAQCAMCRAVLESETSGKAAQGINNGILYLMAIPYVLIAILGYYIFKRLKK